MKKRQNKRHSGAPLGGRPENLRALQVWSARIQAAARRRRLEEVAAELGGDLADPEEFKLLGELASA